MKNTVIINYGLIVKKPIYWSLSDFQRNNLYMNFENKIDTTYTDYISRLNPQHMWLRSQKHRIISLRVIRAICKSRITSRKHNNRIRGLSTLSAYQYSLVTEMFQNFSFPIHLLGLLEYYKSTREIICIRAWLLCTLLQNCLKLVWLIFRNVIPLKNAPK
jgi:hypothetical protein